VGTIISLAGCAHAQTADDWPEQVPVEAGPELEVDAFYDSLSPYGEWIDVGGLGRVWRPYREQVGPDFRPYASGGHWVYTNAGWTFVSTYSWGWGPFHYGHWWFEPTFGWVWLPGSRWAPAWVEWRYGGGYVGWAPVPPPGLRFGFTATWGSPWCFVETRYITQPVVTTYVVPVSRVRTVYTVTQTAPVRSYGRTYYSAGPPAAHVSSVVGVPVRPVPVERVEHTVPPASRRYEARDRAPQRVERVTQPMEVRPTFRERGESPMRSPEWNTRPSSSERETIRQPVPSTIPRSDMGQQRVHRAPDVERAPSTRSYPSQSPPLNRSTVRAAPAAVPPHMGGRAFPGGGRAR
jgi:hypothetical protein